jgi:hypothetical protein
VTALLSLVGDAFGLLFLASGCYLLNKGRDLWGIFFVSLSIAFKVHPIIGAVAILAYFLFARRRFLFKKSLVVFAGTVAVFAAIPILLIPQAYDSVVGFHAVNLQMYTFNLYSGLLDTFSDLASSSTSFVTDLKNYLDYGWLTAVLGAAFYLCWLVAKKVRYLRLASPVDLLSIGIMLWLVLLKQTLPHYFLWALLPLLAMGRLKSSLYLVAGESLGLGFFSLGYFLNQGSQIQYWVLPGMSSSLAFLAGGVSFVLFDLLAMKSLIKDIESQKEVAEDRRIAILSQSIQK